MNIGYIDGQEFEALIFLERQLEGSRNEQEKAQLKVVITRLQEIISKRGEPLPDHSYHALSLKSSEQNWASSR